MDEPVEEAAHLAEVAVARLECVAVEAAQVGVEMVRLEPAWVGREALILGDAQEATERLAVGADRVRRLALDLAAQEIEVDQGG